MILLCIMHYALCVMQVGVQTQEMRLYVANTIVDVNELDREHVMIVNPLKAPFVRVKRAALHTNKPVLNMPKPV